MSVLSARAGTFLKRHVRALVASLALALGLGFILHRGALPLWPPAGTLDHVNWWGVLVMTLLLIFSILTRFARTIFLLKPIATISMRRIMAISSIAVGLITFLPFRLGEFARPAMLREKGKVSGWAVTGTVGAERVIDGVIFSAMLLLGLAFAHPHEPLPDHIGSLPVPAAFVPRAAQLSALFFGAGFLVMGAFFLWRVQARRFTEWTFGLVSKNLAVKIADAVEHLSDGLKFLPNLRYTVPYVLVTIASLVSHIFSTQVLASSVGLPELTFAQATVVVGVLGLGFAVPNAPGFFGTIQLALYAGLAVYVKPEEVVREGAALVFLFYVIYLALVVLLSLGGIVLEYAGSGGDAVDGAAPERS